MATARAERIDLLKFSDHVVMAFASAAQARDARLALSEIGCSFDQVRHWTEAQILGGLKAAIAIDREVAGLTRDARDIRQAYDACEETAQHPRHHWLIVKVKNEGRAQQVVDCVRRFDPQRARHYRRCDFVDLMDNCFPSLAWPARAVVEAT